MKIFWAALFLPSFALAGNLHMIDSNDSTGFALYRLGEPNEKEVAQLCALGVQEIMVLSGNADSHEFKYQSACPSLRVVYNIEQQVGVPLDKAFLEKFDRWVQDSQQSGKKIAFRCNCGCHRTGRLAAYYQMKYQNITKDDAISIMDKNGKFMFLHPGLKPQVQALRDFIKGNACTVETKYCVR